MSIGMRAANEAPSAADEHRSSRRERRLKAAKLVFNNDQSVIDCVLRDLSATGARVRLNGIIDAPEQLVLKVSDGITYSADVMWYRNNELGLRFHGEVKLELVGKLTSVQSVLDEAKALPVVGLLRTLSNYHDFSDDDLKEAREELSSAHERIIELLRAVLHGEEKKVREKQLRASNHVRLYESIDVWPVR